MNSQSTSVSSASSMKEDPSKLSKKPNSPSAVTTTDQSEERDPTPPSQSADEEWVEYVDSFGRTRSCLRKDLPEFTRIDQQLEAKKQERRRERNRSVYNTQYNVYTCIMALMMSAAVYLLLNFVLGHNYICTLWLFQAILIQCFTLCIWGEGGLQHVTPLPPEI